MARTNVGGKLRCTYGPSQPKYLDQPKDRISVGSMSCRRASMTAGLDRKRMTMRQAMKMNMRVNE